MKINKLRLKGFIGIKKGLGLDEIELDFSGLSGVIAFAGPNGRGKTTILDCLQPYRRMAGRRQSLQNHVFLRDSVKELEFSFQGDQYRTLIKIDSESERSEGYIWKNGESLVNGKVTEYDKAIIALLGSPSLFFSSVFCAQNSKKLNDMTTGDLKKLFSELLRLDTLVEHESTAKQCNNMLTGQAEKLEREALDMKERAGSYDQTISSLSRYHAEQEGNKKKSSELTSDLKRAEAELSDIQADIQKNELIKTQIAALQDSVGLVEKDIEADRGQSETELADLRSKYRTADLEIGKLEKLLANEAEIRKAATTKDELTALISKNKGLFDTVSKDHLAAVQSTSKKETERSEYLAEAGLAISEGEKLSYALSLKIDQARLKTSDLGRRDPECKSTTCSFIVSALSAQEGIPKLDARLSDQLADTKIKKKTHATTLNRVDAEIKALKELETGRKSEKTRIEGKIIILEGRLEKIKGLADELAGIDTALTRKNDIEKNRAELADEGEKINIWGERVKAGQKRLEEITNLKAAAEAKINQAADQNLTTITGNIALIKTSMAQIVREINALSGTILSLERESVQAQQAKNAFENKTKERAMVISESSEWAYLKAACSANGLRALEIDSVAPVVTSYANDLLVATFGPLYTVKIRTQDEETGREIFDIIVICEDGSEVLLDNLSGGEKVWSLKALQLAMAMITKEKSGKNFLSAFADEEDGALDVDNAQNFIRLYRSLMPAGGFDDLCFISHKPECVAMADHVLHFRTGGVDIN